MWHSIKKAILTQLKTREKDKRKRQGLFHQLVLRDDKGIDITGKDFQQA